MIAAPSILTIGVDPATLASFESAIRMSMPNSKIVPASDAVAAMVAAQAQPVDGFVLDLTIPGPLTRDFCSQLKAEPTVQDIPVLVLAGPATDAASRAAVLAAGADLLLFWPAEEPEFVSQLQMLVALRAARRSQQPLTDGAIKAALRQSQATLVSILDTLPQSVFWKDREGRYLGCNKVFANAAGLADPAEIVGKTDFDLPWPRAAAEAYRADDQAVMNSGQPKLHIVEPLRQADGADLWIDTTKLPLFDEDNHVYGVLGVYDDITAQKLTAAERYEAEALYRNLLEQAPIGIAVHSEGKIVFTNPACARMMCADNPEQLIGKDIAQFVHPEHWPAVLERIPRVTAGDPDIYPVETVYVRLDGQPIDVDVNVAAVTYQGRPAMQVILRDITEKKRAEAERLRLLAEVQAQAQQTAQILDSVPAGVLLLAKDGQVLTANPRGVNDLAVLAGVAVGERISRLGNLSLTQLLFASATGNRHEVRAKERIFEVITRPISTPLAPPTDDAPIGTWVLVIDDVTEAHALRDQLQQQEQLAALGQLTAGIAHDFNNILAVISLQGELIALTEELTVRNRGRLDAIRKQTVNAAALIQQLLDFGRRAVLERRSIDLAPLLQEQVKLLERTLPENIHISLDCAPGEHVISADPTRIQQLVMNLAVNARDAMPNGGSLHLSLAQQESQRQPDQPPTPWVRLTVSDNGTGIPPEVLPHIFEPFFTTKPRGQGTGLGLAQVYGIVKQHDGEISVHSGPGQGATFTILLPVVATSARLVAALRPAPLRGDGATILLVEDNDALLAAMSDTLQMLGYNVIGAANGAEALGVLAEHASEIALVLTDLVMPRMGGDALLTAMRAQGLRIPVIILSGHPLTREAGDLPADGLAGWLPKPPDLAELTQMLSRAIKGQ